ncbi:MAG: twin-arginine translocase TatA/TatE family subunit [Actinobacteria bacterium]|nr:twin-arginine translocase TatA/TatE family subunit [Actinomycetota bacterium]
MGGFGAPELIIVLVVIVFLFGAKKLPDLASSMGKSIKEFRKATEEEEEEEAEGASKADPEA